MSRETYRRQLARLVSAMSLPNREAGVNEDLNKPSTPERVKMFVDGNLDKRFEKLQIQLKFVAEGFDGFDDLIVEFLRARPLASYDTAASDGERMLVWLAETKSLTLEQLDHVACQRARHAVEELARKHRLPHVRFQELASLAEVYRDQLATDERLKIHLNPVRTWARFVSPALLEDETAPPANVLFFPVREEIATAVLELEGQALVNELADFQPCTLAEWSALSVQADRDELLELSRDLAAMGLVAFG